MAGERNEFEVVFLTAASNEFSFDSVASLLGLIVPTCLRPEDINPNRKIERDEGIDPILP